MIWNNGNTSHGAWIYGYVDNEQVQGKDMIAEAAKQHDDEWSISYLTRNIDSTIYVFIKQKKKTNKYLLLLLYIILKIENSEIESEDIPKSTKNPFGSHSLCRICAWQGKMQDGIWAKVRCFLLFLIYFILKIKLYYFKQ